MNIWEQSFEDLRRPHLEEKKGDGNLANNYPPYGKVTRGDVIAGATGKDQMGGKKLVTAKRYKEMKKEHSSWRSDFKILDEEGCESDNSIKPKRGIKNKITINPELKTEQITTGPVMKPGSGLGGGKLVYPKGQEPKTTGAKLPTLQQAHYEPEGGEISEREMTSSDMQKEKNLKKRYDPSGMKSSMKKQYGTEKGKEVYFATIRKKAKEANTNITNEGALGWAALAAGASALPYLAKKFIGPTINKALDNASSPTGAAQRAVTDINKKNQSTVDAVNQVMPGSASITYPGRKKI